MVHKKLSGILATLALISLLSSFEQPSDLKASMERGKKAYITYCLICHMSEGQGIPGVYPPLAKNPNIASKERMVQATLKGMRGSLTVNGTNYNTDMAPVVLKDQDAADVLNYIRNSWGNKGAQILPKEIQPALKVKVKDYTPY